MESIQFIGTSPNQLVDLIDQKVQSQIDELKKNFQPKDPTKYLTRNEVSEMLQVDLSTVHNWTKKGKIKSYGIGGRVYYKRSEIENAIVELKV